MQRIAVVAGVIVEGDTVLISRRHRDAHQGGLWEFPGGKIEAGESPRAALTRELNEELGIQVEAAQPLMQISHDYPDKSVHLDFWLVQRFSGSPQGREGQQVIRAALSALGEYQFPQANLAVVDHLMKLPVD